MPRRSTLVKDDWRPKFIAALDEGGQLAAAARSVGVDPKTVWNYRQKDPEFARQVRESLECAIERVEDTLYRMAMSGEDTTATIFFLKTRKPQVYGDRLRAEEVESIKASARREVIAEMQRELAELTPAARKVLMAAVPAA